MCERETDGEKESLDRCVEILKLICHLEFLKILALKA